MWLDIIAVNQWEPTSIQGWCTQRCCYHIRVHWLLPGPSSLTGGLGVGFPLDPLNHGRRLDASAGLVELVGEFLMPRTMPTAHVLTP